MIPRFLNADPGKQKSRFGVTLLELHGKDIWIKAAAQFPKKKISCNGGLHGRNSQKESRISCMCRKK